ncbi:MAG: hypothetical protein K2N75_03955 [Helicobacter sp.]|uniref:hypothetical protein n=1 Tax=Helicobacter sp. TaxID=218 RepID=UPI0023CE627A|nr:hypothetical protein [Helicobacter sp.]MDE5926316.1 hypothetical protein [Helicobacter sp.]MDE7175186.1 hypothetical protein [Helicobacter sp.]
MEFLDEGLSFCSFFEVVELEANKSTNQSKSENKSGGAIHLNSTEQNERLMILYSKAQAANSAK